MSLRSSGRQMGPARAREVWASASPYRATSWSCMADGSRPQAPASAAARPSPCASRPPRSATRKPPEPLPDSRHVAPRAGRGEQDPVVPEGSFPVEDRLFVVSHQVAASPGLDDHLRCLGLKQVAVEPLDYNLVLSRAD